MTAPPLTVGRLARRFGLSRSTLLYYDRIGLLRPASRSGANYRRYSAEDAARLAQVCRFRSAGVPLADIARILERSGGDVAAVLERRLGELNQEIARLREQQAVIVRILERPSLKRRVRGLDKAQWVALLRAGGLDEAGMHAWHREFERRSPEAHQDFLESLRLPPGEVRRIRAWARGAAPVAPAERTPPARRGGARAHPQPVRRRPAGYAIDERRRGAGGSAAAAPSARR